MGVAVRARGRPHGRVRFGAGAGAAVWGLGGGEPGTAKAEGRGPRCRVWGGERRGGAGTGSLGLGREEGGRHRTGALLGLVVFVDAGGRFVGLGCCTLNVGCHGPDRALFFAVGERTRFGVWTTRSVCLKKRSILSP